VGRRVNAAMVKWAPVIAWMAVIFSLSAQPGLRITENDGWDFLLRKMGHAIVYGVLAVLVLRALPRSIQIPGAVLFVLAFAVSDELHQTIVRDRSGSLRDIAIDLAGALVGIALWAWIARDRDRTPKMASTRGGSSPPR
jgi:VanZ family protein